MNVNIVIDDFMDLSDNNHIYKKGDLFPFENKVVEEDRVNELSSSNNKRNKKLIKQVKLNRLTEKQLLEYAMILGLDVRKPILAAILENVNTNLITSDSEQKKENSDEQTDKNMLDDNINNEANEDALDENTDSSENDKEEVNE